MSGEQPTTPAQTASPETPAAEPQTPEQTLYPDQSTEAPPAEPQGQDTIEGDPPGDSSPPSGDEPPKDDPPAEGDDGQDDGDKDKDDLLFEEDEDDPKPDEDKDKEGDDGEGDESESDEDEPSEESQFDFDKLEIPADLPVPEGIKDQMSDFAAKYKLDNEGMQAMTDMHVSIMEQQAAQWAEMKETWRNETRSDPDIGGENWAESKLLANNLIRMIWGEETKEVKNSQGEVIQTIKIGGSEDLLKEFQQDLKFLGLGNKRSFIKGLVNIGRMMDNDTIAGAKPGGGSGPKDAAEILYGQDGQGRK